MFLAELMNEIENISSSKVKANIGE